MESYLQPDEHPVTRHYLRRSAYRRARQLDRANTIGGSNFIVRKAHRNARHGYRWYVVHVFTDQPRGR